MARYIDADTLFRCVGSYDPVKWTHEYGRVIRVYDIDSAPTADVVEVVRCRDCKYHEDEVPGMVWCPNIIGNWVNDNWFCADG